MIRRPRIARWWSVLAFALIAPSVALADAWRVVPDASSIVFVARWDGIAFNGVFERWTADIDFEPGQSPTGRFEVNIDTTSINSRSKDRDRGMRGAEWFAVALFPTGRFLAERFERDGDRFRAFGALEVKGAGRDVSAPFAWRTEAGGRRLVGELSLDRRDFDIGAGQWREDAIVGFEVLVRYDIRLEPAP